MTTLSVGQRSLIISINRISTILSKDVRLLYSACGKHTHTHKYEAIKKIFSNTETYKCLKGEYVHKMSDKKYFKYSVNFIAHF